ncbi:uncharacterized protein LOC142331746 [Lycorma delicatula]|uniref:uncharacterized protein LOC142331746 n=1 Tax=Lycorma delicatula TaxID=130591 RepID=UPI003F516106
MGSPTPILKRGFFGYCSLEVGAKIVAWINLVLVIALNIYVFTMIILFGTGVIHEKEFAREDLILGCILCSTISVIFLIIAVFLITGVYKRRPAYIIPWMVLICIILLIVGTSHLIDFYFTNLALYPSVSLLYEVTFGYIGLLIFSYFQEIRSEGPKYVQNL